jgi:hypothetical protein
MVSLQTVLSKLGLFGVAMVAGACSSESPDSGTPNNGGNPPVTGNPMAMPCEPLNSGYPGDERCILPPPADKGLHFHVGPKNYTDPAELAKFEVPAGGEITECYYMMSPNAEVFNFFEQHYRMRQGSHHLIISMGPAGETREEGWAPCETGQGYLPIGGSQEGVGEFPTDGIVAPEDADLFRPLAANVPLEFELHFVNATAGPILREAWVNLAKKEVVEGDRILGGVFLIGREGLQVNPFSKKTLTYQSAPAAEPTRVVSLYGHRHAYTDRFTVWANRGGVRELIYEDYDWKEPTELSYNSVIKNKAPDPVGKRAGGVSGILDFAVGDTLEWECEINNTSEHTLTFSNAVYTGEMCNVFGSLVGPLFWRGRGVLTASQ